MLQQGGGVVNPVSRTDQTVAKTCAMSKKKLLLDYSSAAWYIRIINIYFPCYGIVSTKIHLIVSVCFIMWKPFFKIIWYCPTKDNKTSCLGWCRCPKGELFDYLTEVVTLSEKRTRQIMRQLLEAVNFCHQQNIVHRDLKVGSRFWSWNFDQIPSFTSCKFHEY